MFRNRYEELNELIIMYQLLDRVSSNENLTNISHDIQVVNEFVLGEIRTLSINIIEGMLDDKLFDYEFSLLVYKFKPELCRKIFQESIAKFYEKFGFSETISFTARCTYYFIFAIMSYEVIHQKIRNDKFLTNDSFALSTQLHKMRTMRSFQGISNDLNTKVLNISQELPLYVEDLPESSTVLLIPNHERDYGDIILTLHHHNDGVFKLQNDEGLNLFIEPGLHSWIKVFQKWPKVDFVRGDATQMKIELYDKQDISKGYTIRTAADNFYLCASLDENNLQLHTEKDHNKMNYIWVFKTPPKEVTKNVRIKN